MTLFVELKLLQIVSLTFNYNPNSSKILLLVLPDFGGFSTPQYSPADRACSHVYLIHLLLDSGLCIAKPWMLCIWYCTNSIEVQTIGVPFYCMLMDLQTIGVPFYCMLMDLEDLGWFLAKIPRRIGLMYILIS